MLTTQITLDFKHESSYKVWVEVAKHTILACKKAEKRLKRGQSLSIASLDIEIDIFKAPKKKAKKK